MKALVTCLFTFCLLHVSAQPLDLQHPSYPFAQQYLDTLKTLLAIPNDANFPKDIQKNVDWCAAKLQSMDFSTQELSTETVPLLYASYNSKVKDALTYLFYFHIDGQPVDPQFWFQDNPYDATLKQQIEAEGWVDMDWSALSKGNPDPEWRIFARSASDDKSPFVMFLAAMDQIRQEKKALPFNLKIVLDFEEEKGSPRLAKTVEKNKATLAADRLVIFDGPAHYTNAPSITFGARGITTFSLTVYGPTFPLHSGHYGNYAPNPAIRLAQLLGSMKDEQGRVLIEGFYEGIELTAATKKILANVGDNEKEIQVKLGIGAMDSVGNNYQEALQYPSLNIRGLSAGWVREEARTIIPATALAEVDIRLVLETDGERLIGLVKKHIEEQGYLILDRKPNSRERVLNPKICQFQYRKPYAAFRTELDSPIGIWAYEQLKETFGQEPIRKRTTGGSLPTSPFIATLEIPAVIIPLVNGDNNQHSPNENLRLGNWSNGVKTFYGILH